LTGNIINNYEPLQFKFLDENIVVIEEEGKDRDRWTLYFDKIVNVSNNGLGEILISPSQEQYLVAIIL